MKCIQNGLIMIGGDLNFTLGASEIWGLVALVDYLLVYILIKMEEVGLLYIETAELTPTHRNKRTGDDRIMKRLDWFLIYEDFLDEVARVKQWVTSRGESNHCLVVL
jgi:hypothetical protein